jgi:hypothetical protein
MEDGHPLEVHRQLYPHIDKPAVRHVTAGDQQAVQMNDVTDMQLFNIFTANWCLQRYLHSVTLLAR